MPSKQQHQNNFTDRNSNETIIIYENIEPNDNFPYFTCPKCQRENITRAFSRCIDCGAKLKWEIMQ